MIELTMEQSTDGTDLRTASPANDKQIAETAQRSDKFASELVKLFKLLSDETRLRILLALSREEEMHVRALCELLGQSQPAVSHHLALLRVAGLIDRRREGKHNFYFLVSGQIDRFFDLVFDSTEKQDRQLRFEDYVLRYVPA